MKPFFLACSLLVLFGFAVSAQTINLKYAFWGNPDAIGVEKDIIDAYQAKHPNVKITPVAIAYNDYHAKLLIMIAGGQSPDVMRIDSYFFQDFMKNKVLKDLTKLISTNKFDLSKLYSVGLQDVKVGDRIYGLPWSTSPNYLFINKKMFAAAGIPVPSASWTYNDFMAICKKLSKGEGENQQWGYGFYLGEYYPLLSFVWGVGGDLFDSTRTKFALNNPAVVSRLDELQDAVKKGCFTNPFTFSNGDQIARYFSQNKTAMIVGAGSVILSLQKIEGLDFAVLPFPGTAKVPAVTMYKSNIVGISEQTKNEKAAWEFLSFLRGYEGEKLYMEAKRMPPTYNDQTLWDIYADPKLPPANLKGITQLISEKYGRTLQLRSGWTEIQNLILQALQKSFSGQTTNAKALAEVAPKVQAILDKNK